MIQHSKPKKKNLFFCFHAWLPKDKSLVEVARKLMKDRITKAFQKSVVS